MHHFRTSEPSDGVILAQKDGLFGTDFFTHPAENAANHIDIELARIFLDRFSKVEKYPREFDIDMTSSHIPQKMQRIISISNSRGYFSTLLKRSFAGISPGSILIARGGQINSQS